MSRYGDTRLSQASPKGLQAARHPSPQQWTRTTGSGSSLAAQLCPPKTNLSLHSNLRAACPAAQRPFLTPAFSQKAGSSLGWLRSGRGAPGPYLHAQHSLRAFSPQPHWNGCANCCEQHSTATPGLVWGLRPAHWRPVLWYRDMKWNDSHWCSCTLFMTSSSRRMESKVL